MSLIIATGSNMGNSKRILVDAQEYLQNEFQLIKASRIYRSKAVDYENQPDFYNQVLEFQLPTLKPEAVMQKLLQVEIHFGRSRDIPKGPRTLDIDIIFWGNEQFNSEQLTIPHPRWPERSFVVRPLQELPFFQTVEKCFTIPKSFQIEAYPV